MKKAFKYILCAGVAVAFAACAPMEPKKPDLGPLPTVSESDYSIAQGDKAYRYIFKVTKPECVGIWDFGDNGGIQVGNDMTVDFAFAGSYTFKFKVYNKGGISNEISIPFTTEQGSATEQGSLGWYLTQGPWVWDYTTLGHLGNGPADATAPSWWIAGPNEQDPKVYDDVLTFRLDGVYTIETNGWVLVNEDAAVEFGAASKPSGSILMEYTQPATPAQRWSISNNQLSFTNGGFPSYVPSAGWGTKRYDIITLNETTLQLRATYDWGAFFMRFVHPAE